MEIQVRLGLKGEEREEESVDHYQVAHTCFVTLLNCNFAAAFMAGGNFLHRIVSYVVNELVVESLANSPAFQRFAVRTSRRLEDISNMATQKRQELAEQIKEVSKNFEEPFKHQR